ncbi:MAG: hypothetical protein E6I08_01910, partial [Chloroflexi bacterium]
VVGEKNRPTAGAHDLEAQAARPLHELEDGAGLVARGYSSEFPVERYWRDAKGMQIYEGTAHIQRVIVARSLLGKPEP